MKKDKIEILKPIKTPCPNPKRIVIKIKSDYADPDEFGQIALANHVTSLNYANRNKFYLHTFRWKKSDKCCQVVMAKLKVRLRANQDGRPNFTADAGNDTIAIVKDGGQVIQPNNQAIYPSEPFPLGTEVTVTFNLTGSELDWINTTGKLSFRVQDDTAVKWGKLELRICCPKKIGKPFPQTDKD